MRALLRLRPYLARHGAAYGAALLGLVTASVFGLLVPWMIREAVDAVGAPDGRRRLLVAVSWILVFASLHALFRLLARRTLLVASRRAERALRRDLFAHVIRLPLPFFGGTSTGDILSRMTNDVSAVWLCLGPGLLTLAGTVISYVLALAFMFRLSPSLTALALAVAPLVVLVSREYGKAFHRQHRMIQETLSAMNGVLQENVAGIRLVKAYGLEGAEEERFARECNAYYARSVAVSRTSAAFHGATGFLAGTGAALVLLLGGLLVIRGRMTLGGFVAFNAYLAMLAFPTMALGWVINLVQRGSSAMGRIDEYLRLPAEEDESGGSGRGAAETEARPPARLPHAGEGGGAPAPDGRGAFLEVRDLSFSYDGGRGPVLARVSFTVGPGEVVGLAGKTGSGKSTLLSLLLRLQSPPKGTVFLRGTDVLDLPLDELRRAVSWVGQDPFLFSDTVLENLCHALPAPDDRAARDGAARAGLLAEIEEMPEGFRTVIGERGISLSGGQKQRATIARALVAGGSLLLLDDALSSVDAWTERTILDSLIEGRGGQAVVLSTHRMASLARCGRILVLADGQIAEEGTHDELLSRRGVYFDLYARQMLSRELEEAP